jgi:hypothetical protein
MQLHGVSGRKIRELQREIRKTSLERGRGRSPQGVSNMSFLRAFALTKAHSLAVSWSDDTIRNLEELFLRKILSLTRYPNIQAWTRICRVAPCSLRVPVITLRFPTSRRIILTRWNSDGTMETFDSSQCNTSSLVNFSNKIFEVDKCIRRSHAM